jgi:SAM-dependent methyltransferase
MGLRDDVAADVVGNGAPSPRPALSQDCGQHESRGSQVAHQGVSGRDQYAAKYRAELGPQAEWLRYGAAHKVDSIEALLERDGVKPGAILELGCGTGAVITECQRRGVGETFSAVDYSQEAMAYLESHSRGIHCLVADITDPAFSLHELFDVVVLSHVLEHLEDPLTFLRSMIARVRFRHLVAEVPLEDLLGARIKNLVRDRRHNPAGHVQFFTQRTFRRLLSSAGLDLRDDRRYFPLSSPEAVEFVCKKDGLSKVRELSLKATRCYLPRIVQPLWERAYYAHYAALCVPLGAGRS